MTVPKSFSTSLPPTVTEVSLSQLAIIMTVCCAILQLLIDTMEQTTIAEKYRLIAKRASQISKEEFGDLLQNKDVKDLYDLVQNIYKQVTAMTHG